MTFPTIHEVSWLSFIEGLGEDILGNDIEDWEDPVSRKVIGWGGATTEKYAGIFNSRGVFERALQVPSDFSFKLRDRCALPDDGLYEVVGSDDRSHGFHGWQPGNVIHLKLVTG